MPLAGDRDGRLHSDRFWRKTVGVRFHLSAPAGTAAALSLVCLVLVVAGGSYPLIARAHWQWSWESPALAFAGYGLATASLVGATMTAWLSLRGGRWTHVAVTAAFVALGTVGIYLSWRSGAWLSGVRAEILPGQ